MPRPSNPKSKARPRFIREQDVGRRFPPILGASGNLRAREKSDGKGGTPQLRRKLRDLNPAGKTRTQPRFPRRRAPQNPHDPKSKDPFMRAGIGLGTNDTKIFGRAGMSMDIKKMRKMF